jgi:hypothetical protein
MNHRIILLYNCHTTLFLRALVQLYELVESQLAAWLRDSSRGDAIKITSWVIGWHVLNRSSSKCQADIPHFSFALAFPVAVCAQTVCLLCVHQLRVCWLCMREI